VNKLIFGFKEYFFLLYMTSYGFIFSRHIKNEKDAQYWYESYKSIRTFYPNIKIIIIDNNSDYNYINKELEIINCDIIQSDFQDAGYFCCYYYFNKHKWFDKAIIIHDTIFINTFISFDDIDDIIFLWHFTNHQCDNVFNERFLLSKLSNNYNILELHNIKHLWNGCFGMTSVITYDFLERLVIKYNLFNMLPFVNKRCYRLDMERVFGLICTYEKPSLINKSSLFDLHAKILPGDYSYTSYKNDKLNGIFNDKEKYRMIKVYGGR